VDATRIADIPITELIGESWQDVLDRLTGDMDPWNIDLAELARRYRDYLRALQELQFEVSGRMVLVCSILLRMKSDQLLAEGRPPDRDGLVASLEEAVEGEVDAWEPPIMPDEEFDLPVLRRPRRQVTLLDLRRALQSALRVSRRRAERLIEHTEEDDYDPFANYEIGGVDFAARLRSIYERIRELLSGRRVLSFFRLLDRGDREERVRRFFEVLHLVAEGQISCRQETFLGDIVITLEGDG